MIQQALLVRHCQTTGQGPDSPLTRAGLEQALHLAERLSDFPIDHLVSSPYSRARATIEPFASLTGLFINIDERLAEHRLTPEPVNHWRDLVRRTFEDAEFRVAGGESGRETLERAWKAIESVLKGGYRLPLISSHGQLLGLVLNSIEPGFGYAGWCALGNPDIYLLERNDKGDYAFRRP